MPAVWNFRNQEAASAAAYSPKRAVLLLWLTGYSFAQQTGRILPLHVADGTGMRKFLFGTAALIVLVCPALSADMRAPAYKAPPPAVWSWTSCYGGSHAGGVWVSQKD